MSTEKRYSCIATPEAMTFLVNNTIRFVYTKGIQKRKFRLYFAADDETVEALEGETGVNAVEEVDGWDFNAWDAIERKY